MGICLWWSLMFPSKYSHKSCHYNKQLQIGCSNLYFSPYIILQQRCCFFFFFIIIFFFSCFPAKGGMIFGFFFLEKEWNVGTVLKKERRRWINLDCRRGGGGTWVQDDSERGLFCCVPWVEAIAFQNYLRLTFTKPFYLHAWYLDLGMSWGSWKFR